MVFKMITSGKHVKKINGKLLKDQEFNLDVNPNGQNRIFLKTQEFENGKHKIYKNNFDSIDNFMADFQKNNNSLFELNKNIIRPKYSRHFRFRRSPRTNRAHKKQKTQHKKQKTQHKEPKTQHKKPKTQHKEPKTQHKKQKRQDKKQKRRTKSFPR